MVCDVATEMSRLHKSAGDKIGVEVINYLQIFKEIFLQDALSSHVVGSEKFVQDLMRSSEVA